MGREEPPDHEPNLLFTRMLGGSMDFTPGIVSLTGQEGKPINSTLARQLALYVVIYSPVVMLADTPGAYARVPDAMPFLRAMPTDWSNTRVLAGEVGDYAILARRVRGGRDWYVGGVTDELAPTVSVSSNFLDHGRSYTVNLYSDGPRRTIALTLVK